MPKVLTFIFGFFDTEGVNLLADTPPKRECSRIRLTLFRKGEIPGTVESES